MCLEIVVRFYIFGLDALSVEKLNSQHELGVSGLLRASAVPEAIFELKPKLRTLFKRLPFETNSHGMRDRDYTVRKPGRTFRVAVIGDSFTMGGGIRIEDAFHSVLEDKLNTQGGEWAYEFLNFGVGGYTVRQYAAVIEGKAHEFAPDLIVIGYCTENDDHIPPEKHFHRTYKPKAAIPEFYYSFTKKWAAVGLYQASIAVGATEESNRSDSISPRTQKYLSEMFGRIARYRAQHDIPIVVIYLATRPWAHDAVDPIAVANGLITVDSGRHFRATDAREYRVNVLDGHPNEAANRIYASLLLQTLIDHQLLPNTAPPATTAHLQ